MPLITKSMVGTKMMVQGTWSKAAAVVTRIKVTVFKRMLFPAQANWALLADPFNQRRCFCGYLLGLKGYSCITITPTASPEEFRNASYAAWHHEVYSEFPSSFPGREGTAVIRSDRMVTLASISKKRTALSCAVPLPSHAFPAATPTHST